MIKRSSQGPKALFTSSLKKFKTTVKVKNLKTTLKNYKN